MKERYYFLAIKGLFKPSYAKPWQTFCILIGLIFVARGLLFLCFYPPLEGPDEYQHIAYMVYLNENKTTPIYGKAEVPTSLYDELVNNPHSAADWLQTRGIGAKRYGDFYQEQLNYRVFVPVCYKDFYAEQPSKILNPGVGSYQAQPKISNPGIGLYQAQHPPLYYRLFAPLYRLVHNHFGFREAVYFLRIINIIFAGLAMALFVHPLNLVFQSPPFARLSALTISLMPMYLVYVSRVCNDALALLISALIYSVLARMADDQFIVMKSLILGFLIGIGTLTKLMVLSFLPVSVGYFIYLSFFKRFSRRRIFFSLFMIVLVYLLICHRYHINSYREFGTPFPAQETIKNIASGRSFYDIVKASRLDHLRSFLVIRLVKEGLWTSGWSFLKPNPLFSDIYSWILLLCFCGVFFQMFWWVKNGQGMAGLHSRIIIICSLTVFFTFLAAYAHALSTIVAWGPMLTPGYYIMVGYPAFLTCAFAALRGYRSRVLSFAAVTALMGTFVITEFHSLLFIAVPYWTNSRSFRDIYSRLISIHPFFPSPHFILPLSILVVLLLSTALRSVLANTSCLNSHMDSTA